MDAVDVVECGLHGRRGCPGHRDVVDGVDVADVMDAADFVDTLPCPAEAYMPRPAEVYMPRDTLAPATKPIKNLFCAFLFKRKQICLEMDIFLIWYFFLLSLHLFKQVT